MKFFFITILAFLSTASNADNRQVDIDKMILISNFIEESNCDYFYYDDLDMIEMSIAGSHSKICLNKYVDHIIENLNRKNWVTLIFYLSSKRDYKLLLKAYNRKSDEYETTKKSIVNELCFQHSEKIKIEKSLSELCSSKNLHSEYNSNDQ